MMPFAMYFARDTGCFLGHYRMNRRLVVPHAPLLEVATCDIQASHLSHYQVAYGPTSHRERGDRQPNHIHPPTHPPTHPSIYPTSTYITHVTPLTRQTMATKPPPQSLCTAHLQLHCWLRFDRVGSSPSSARRGPVRT